MERATIRADTLQQVSTESVTAETVAAAVSGDSVSLTVPMTVLQSLPDGAMFTKKEGRTRLSLKRDGDSVTAEASTDSIGRQVTRYERKARDNLQREIQVVTEQSRQEKPPNSNWACWILAGIMGTVTVLILIKVTFK